MTEVVAELSPVVAVVSSLGSSRRGRDSAYPRRNAFRTGAGNNSGVRTGTAPRLAWVAFALIFALRAHVSLPLQESER